MIRKVVVPTMSANVTDATLVAWYKEEGETVLKGEPLIELTTEKTAFEMESPCKGVLRRQVAPIKSVLPAGYVVALVGGASDPLPDVDTANRKLIDKYRSSLRTPTTSKKDRPSSMSKARVRATPAARRIARENAIELTDVQAMMGGNVVSEALVLQFLTQRKGGSE